MSSDDIQISISQINAVDMPTVSTTYHTLLDFPLQMFTYIYIYMWIGLYWHQQILFATNTIPIKHLVNVSEALLIQQEHSNSIS